MECDNTRGADAGAQINSGLGLMAEKAETNAPQGMAHAGPYEVAANLRELAGRYAQGGPEQRMLLQAAESVIHLHHAGHTAVNRQIHAERVAENLRDKIKLALLALA